MKVPSINLAQGDFVHHWRVGAPICEWQRRPNLNLGWRWWQIVDWFIFYFISYLCKIWGRNIRGNFHFSMGLSGSEPPITMFCARSISLPVLPLFPELGMALGMGLGMGLGMSEIISQIEFCCWILNFAIGETVLKWKVPRVSPKIHTKQNPKNTGDGRDKLGTLDVPKWGHMSKSQLGPTFICENL